MPVIVDDQLYYRTAEVGRHQQKYPLQMVKGGHSPNRILGLAGLETIYRTSDRDHWNEGQPCYGNKPEKLSRWIYELNG
jgi:hypothetical protein